jgi:hypothetical protein
MNKVAIEEVESVLLEQKIDPKKVSEIIRALEEIAEEISDASKESESGSGLESDGLPADPGDDSTPKEKSEYLIVLNDPDNVLDGAELMGWVVQQKEGHDAGTVLKRLSDAAKDQNEGAKRKKSSLTSMIQLFEGIKSKFLKSHGIKVKTKEAVRVLVTDGKIV